MHSALLATVILSSIAVLEPVSAAVAPIRQEAAASQASPPDGMRQPAPGIPSINAARLDAAAPTIDGRLDEDVWSLAEVATGFVQHRPDAGAPASEQTEVRVLYDDDALYVGIRLHDSSPDSIIGRLARRDEPVHSDWFYVGIDSYRDRRTAFVFGVNPRGVQRDYIIYDDNRMDPSWDAVWQAAAVVDSAGWSAEFRIPFSQLRFSLTGNDAGPPAASVTADASGGENTTDARGLVWGINFERRIARSDEVSYWAPVPGDAAGLVSLYGELRGLTGITAPRRLELRPYGMLRVAREPGAADDPFHRPNDLFGSAGLDLRYGVTSDLTLSLTVNPDFGQVEADPSVLNLTAFETFFEEKRPFFLEGSEIFDVGWPQLFYSRRIGRAPQGSPPAGAAHVDVPESTTILAAAKLTGKTAGGWSIGLLEAVTGREYARFVDGSDARSRAVVEPLTSYSVARVQRDFRDGGSAIGAILTATHRDLGSAADTEVGGGTVIASLDRLHRAAWAAAIDGRHRFGGGNYEVNGMLLASHVRGSTEALARTQRTAGRYFQRPDADHVEFDPERTRLGGIAARTRIAKIGGGKWRWSAAGHAFSPGFEINDLGFHLWPDEMFLRASVGYHQFRPGRIFRDWRLDVGSFGEWTFGGERTDAAVDAFGRFTFVNHWGGYAHYMRHPAALAVNTLRGGPALFRPARHMGGFNLHSDRRRSVNAQANVNWDIEDGTGGRVLSGSLRLDIRPSTRLDLSIGPRLTLTRNPWQYVTAASVADSTRYVVGALRRATTALTSRLNYTFSPTLSLQLYAQPFISAGNYADFATVAEPRAPDFDRRFRRLAGDQLRRDAGTGRYYVHLDGGDAPDFDFRDPDFNFRQLRSNLVLRWEYRPGSTLFVVWGSDRTDFHDDGTLRLRRDFQDLLRAPASNVLLVKVNYWLGR